LMEADDDELGFGGPTMPKASLKELMEADDDELGFGGPTMPKAKKLSGSGMALGGGMSLGGKAKNTSTSLGGGMSLTPKSKSAASPSYKATNSGTGFGMGKPSATSSAAPSQNTSTSLGGGMSLTPKSKSAASPSFKATNSGTGFGIGKPSTTSSTAPSQAKAKAMPALNQQQSSFGSNPMNTSINNSSFQSTGNINTSTTPGRGMSLQSQSSAKMGGASSPEKAKGGGKVEKPIAKKISVEFDDDVWNFE